MEDKKTECDCVATGAEGKYISAGLVPVQTPSALVVLAFLHCRQCGSLIIREKKMSEYPAPPKQVGVPVDLSDIMKK